MVVFMQFMLVHFQSQTSFKLIHQYLKPLLSTYPSTPSGAQAAEYPSNTSKGLPPPHPVPEPGPLHPAPHHGPGPHLSLPEQGQSYS